MKTPPEPLRARARAPARALALASALAYALALCAAGALALSGCGATSSLFGRRVSSWARSSDQERLDLLRVYEGAAWGVAQGQLLAWELQRERLYVCSTPLPSEVVDLWVEPLDPARVNARRAALYERRVTELEAKARAEVARAATASAAALDEIVIEDSGLVIEGDELVIEEAPPAPAPAPAPAAPAPAPAPAPTPAAPAELPPLPKTFRRPPPPPEVKARLRVYAASPRGLFTREVWLDAEWRDALGDQPWALVRPGAVGALAPREGGGAWWAGASGFGWRQGGKVKAQLGRARATALAPRPGGGAWVGVEGAGTLAVPAGLWADGEPLEVEQRALPEVLREVGEAFAAPQGACEGAPVALSARGAEAVALCGGGAARLSVWREGAWWPLSGDLPAPEGGALHPWGEGWVYWARGAWWALRLGAPVVRVQEDGAPKDGGRALVALAPLPVEGGRAGEPARAYAERLALTDVQPFEGGAWVARGGAEPLLAWARPHLGVVTRAGADGARRQRLVSESFAARSDMRPYLLDAAGALWVPHAGGAWVQGQGAPGWSFVAAPEGAGRALGVALCPGGPLFVTSRRLAPAARADAAPELKLLVELWAPGAAAPAASLDWSAAAFRPGEPKLGDVVCDPQGAVSAALFWGPGDISAGVGLLHIPASRDRVEVWEHRQGYDGEEALSKTPLLPSFTVNALVARPDGGLFVATHSGLADVGPPVAGAPSSARVVTVHSEASNWPTDLMTDLALGTDGRLWIATDRGVLLLPPGEARPRPVRPFAAVSAIALTPGTQEVWAAFQDKLLVGDGTFEGWSRVHLTVDFAVGVIRRVLPLGAAGEGAVWLATQGGLLRGD